ncbi:uncharacterized protein B0P05DRAFT_570510 [Gilbertella persicaria]|uniref:uncharacterized protein n=1 Tax=Gilbertella persicaria TaxID=101096 RepID=UPI00221F1617|nr:uncharacterized protein B0P05DRAFT_570510 [Gilbertella persicaria]KAI8084117.1 hypothetical protein B0P05DRAFT_570510 [Gilbertella persicaria]
MTTVTSSSLNDCILIQKWLLLRVSNGVFSSHPLSTQYSANLDFNMFDRGWPPTEEKPFLMFFVYKYIKQLKQMNEQTEALQRLLKKRRREDNATNAITTDAPDAAAIIDATASDNSNSPTTLSAALTLTSSSVASISTNTNWVHNGYNMTVKLTELRRKAVTMEGQDCKLNASQKLQVSLSCILMLNHIYFVSDREQKSISKFLPQQLYLFLNNLNKNALPAVPNVAKSWTEELKSINFDFVENDISFEDRITKLLRRKTLSYMSQASKLEDDILISYASILNEVVASHKR